VAVAIDSSIAVTEAGDVFAATEAVAIASTVAVTEAPDVFAATDAVAIASTIAVTEEADVFAASVTAATSSSDTTINVTEANDSFAADAHAGFPALLSAAIVEADDVLAASDAVAINATAAATEAGDTSSSAVAVLVSGSIAVTDAPDRMGGAAYIRLDATEASDYTGGAFFAFGPLETYTRIVPATRTRVVVAAYSCGRVSGLTVKNVVMPYNAYWKVVPHSKDSVGLAV